MNEPEWIDHINELDQYIVKLERASKSVGELFYEAIQTDTIEIFTQYLTGFYDIAQAITTTVENSEQFAPGLQEKAEPHVTELLNQFEQIRSLVAQERFVMLADILKYEVPNSLNFILLAIREQGAQ